jgi:PmbA protein
MKSALEIARDLVKNTREFDAFEVICHRDRMTEMQIDAGEVSLLRTTENVNLTLRAIHGGRYATVDLNQTDSGSYAQALEKMREALKSAPVDEARALAPKGVGPEKASRGPTEPDLAKMHDRIVAFARGTADQFRELKMEQAMLQFNRDEASRVNSLGYESEIGQGTYDFTAMFSGKRGDKTSSFNYSGATSQDLDRELIEWGALKRIMQSSIREIDHEAFDGKFKGQVVIAPEAVDNFVWPFLAHLGDDRLIAGTSQLRDKMEQQVASELLTIRVNPERGSLGRREFATREGYASKKGVIVKNGVLKTWLLSDYGARKTGLPRATTGAANLEIDAGEISFADLIKPIKKGLLLGRFSGGSPAANGEISGVAKNSYLIENGQVTKPLSEVMISANVFDMLKQVEAVSRDRMDDGMTLKPYIRVNGVTVAGK